MPERREDITNLMVSMPCDVVRKKIFVSSEPAIFSIRQLQGHETRQAIERVRICGMREGYRVQNM